MARITDFFSVARPGQRPGAQARLRLIVLAVQAACIGVAPLVSLAASADWKLYYDRGEGALAEQKPAAAEDYFRKALSLTEDSSPLSADGQKCLKRLADTLALRNKTADAEKLYQRLLSILFKQYGNTKPIVPVLISLGSIQESLGDHDKATVYYERAFRINEKSYGPYSPEFVENVHAMARANARAGNRGKAEKQYKQAISILMQEPSLKASEQLKSVTKEYSDLLQGYDDSDRSLIKDFKKDLLNNSSGPGGPGQSGAERFSSVDRREPSGGAVQPDRLASQSSPAAPWSSTNPAGDGPEAAINKAALPSSQDHAMPRLRPPIELNDQGGSASTWQKQMAIKLNASVQAQINKDPEVVLRGLEQPWSAKTLGAAYQTENDSIANQSRYGKGEADYKRMIATDINALGPYHPSVANDLSGLALLYVQLQNYTEAEPLLSRAYEIYKKAYGLDNLLTINTLSSYALVESRLGKTAQAEELYQSALSHSQSALGANNLQTARVLNELAYLYFHEGKLEQAGTMYKWALASTEAAVGQTSPLLAACLHDYAHVLRSLGQGAEASVMESRADSIASQPK